MPSKVICACRCRHPAVPSAAEPVNGSILAFEGVNNVHGRHCLSATVFCVRHGVANDVLQEDLEDAPGLFVDEAGQPLDSTTASEPPNRWLCDALNVVAEHFAVALGASFAQAQASFASSGHDLLTVDWDIAFPPHAFAFSVESTSLGLDSCAQTAAISAAVA
jgi:hypothetical protein